MTNEQIETLKMLAARHDAHVAFLAEAKKHTDVFVVVPKDSDGEPSVSLFVETMQGGGYKVNAADEPYHYIFPDALNVARIMRKNTRHDFALVKLTDWHKRVIDLLAPYKKLAAANA